MNIQCLSSGSKGNCYTVSDGYTTLLLECGVSIKDIKIWLKHDLSSIDGCLVTHEHLDHAKAVKQLLKSAVDVYMSAGTALALGVLGHRTQIIKSREVFRIGTLDIMPFDVPHDAKEPLCFYIVSRKTGKSLVYITDAMYCKYRFNNITHLMIEANHDLYTINKNLENDTLHLDLRNRIHKNHMSFEQTMEFLKMNDLSKLEQVYLIHLSDSNSDEKRYKKEIQTLTNVKVSVLG